MYRKTTVNPESFIGDDFLKIVEKRKKFLKDQINKKIINFNVEENEKLLNRRLNNTDVFNFVVYDFMIEEFSVIYGILVEMTKAINDLRDDNYIISSKERVN